MKKLLYIFIPILFFGCIDEYKPVGVEEISDLLVIEGTITDDESVFILQRSVGLSDVLTDDVYVNDAEVCVEKDNGEILYGSNHGSGRFVVPTGALDAYTKYRLYVKTGGEEYRSEFLQPLFTPAIDSIAPLKEGQGEPVFICVYTHDPKDQSRYYLWSYEETWEVKAELFAQYGYLTEKPQFFNIATAENTYYCWGRDKSKTMLLGSSDKLLENVIYQKKLKEISCTNDRISELYYIKVKQNQIRKEAYDYYSNIQKNIEQTGSIFAPVPSEMSGNIKSITNPGLPVIGYIDVSSTVIKDIYLPVSMGLYEGQFFCFSMVTDDPQFAYPVYGYYEYEVRADPPIITYAPYQCVDCRLKERASKKRPDFWPNNHQ